MNLISFPWLEVAIGAPLCTTFVIRHTRQPETARSICLAVSVLGLLMTLGGWLDLWLQGIPVLENRWLHQWMPGILEIDHLNAPLLVLTSLLLTLKALTTLRTKLKKFSFDLFLWRSSLALAVFACREPWMLLTLASVAMVPPWMELRQRGQPTRIYTIHMGLCVACLFAGQALVSAFPAASATATAGMGLLVVGVLIRSGMFPFHTWVPDLFQRATFGTSLLFVAPMTGVYLATRLLLPTAPDWLLSCLAHIAAFTAVYAGGLALVQKESRRFYSYLFLSQSALVLMGLNLITPLVLTGALSLWLSMGLALGGFGLVLRSIEARIGPFSLEEYRGLYSQMPTLAAFFLLTGLASIGFPGTVGFISWELILDGVVGASPFLGVIGVISSALNGIAILMAYLRIFTGAQSSTTISLRILPRERVAVLVVTLLLIGGGLFPQPAILSRYQAAMELVEQRGVPHDIPNASPHGSHSPSNP